MSFADQRIDPVPGVLDDLSQIAHEDLSPADFYAEVLGRIASIFSVRHASVSLIAGGNISLACRVGEPGADDSVAIDELIQKAAIGGEARFVVPGFSQNGQATENPTDDLILIAPVSDQGHRLSVIQLSLPETMASSDQESCFRFLSIICDIAASFHRNVELSLLRGDRNSWKQIDDFARSVHSSLVLSEVCYLICNDGLRVIGCDRLLLLQNQGRSYRLEAVSGLESVNRRSGVARCAEKLAARVAPMGEAFEYPTDLQLAPQLAEAVEAYVDESGTSQLVVVPLVERATKDEVLLGRDETHGVLIAENFSGQSIARSRVELIAEHSLSALRNVREHRRVFLLPVWSAIGNTAWVIRARTMPKLVVSLLVLIGLVLAAIFVKVDFNLAADGTLQPAVRNYIFAPADGLIEELSVEHLSHVETGDVLARVRSFDMDLRLEELQGEIDTTENKLQSVKSSRTDVTAGSLTQIQINRLAAEEEELKQWQESLQNQFGMLKKQKKSLEIRSPITGDIITWDVRNLLTSRPVTRGQILMTVAQLDGQWQLELHLPDRRIGHLRDAENKSKVPLEVSFILAADPGSTLIGTVRETDDITSTNDTQLLGLRVMVDVNEDDIAQLRAGGKVMANIRCGRRAVGYVWLHELFEFVQSKILFRLS